MLRHPKVSNCRLARSIAESRGDFAEADQFIGRGENGDLGPDTHPVHTLASHDHLNPTPGRTHVSEQPRVVVAVPVDKKQVDATIVVKISPGTRGEVDHWLVQRTVRLKSRKTIPHSRVAKDNGTHNPFLGQPSHAEIQVRPAIVVEITNLNVRCLLVEPLKQADFKGHFPKSRDSIAKALVKINLVAGPLEMDGKYKIEPAITIQVAECCPTGPILVILGFPSKEPLELGRFVKFPSPAQQKSVAVGR